MKALLMHRDRDFDLEGELPPHASDLTQDLDLETLFGAMSQGDGFLHAVARHAVLSSLTDPEGIAYRQQILEDCLEHPDVVRELYATAVAAIAGEKKVYIGFLARSPSAVLHRSVQVLELFTGFLKRLRQIADAQGSRFRSEGFVRFFGMLAQELDDDYLRLVEAHLQQLGFRDGVLVSARLGRGNKGTDHVLRQPLEERRGWLDRLFRKNSDGYSFEIAERDEGGYRALSELRDRGINPVANALAQSTDHMLSFFGMLRAELGFYVGCLNLHERLREKGEPTCAPTPATGDGRSLSARGLYDVCLALRLASGTVGNDLSADRKQLVIITGANQGGKSTFLRSLGLAYLMMQCGMFVGAHRFSASVCQGVFTHFRRGEDPAMKSGKLDEELSRMSGIVDHLRRGCLLLFNESFASTNEREGSEIARQIIRALLDAGVRVFVVTHLFDLAHGFHDPPAEAALFLRAARGAGGQRTFGIVPGEPLPTSYGEDLFRRIFATDGEDGEGGEAGEAGVPGPPDPGATPPGVGA